MPKEATVAHALLSTLAIQLGRCPRYNHRVKSPRVISISVLSLSCMSDRGFRPLPHLWIKNRSEYITQSTPLSVSSTFCPTFERHPLEMPGTLITFLLIIAPST